MLKAQLYFKEHLYFKESDFKDSSRGERSQKCCGQDGGGKTDFIIFLILWIKQTSGLMGLCPIKPAVACAGLTASTSHCPELAIDRAVDGEIGNGLTMGLSFQVPSGELSCSQLPLIWLWQFAGKGEEILGLRCLHACPHFTL